MMLPVIVSRQLIIKHQHLQPPALHECTPTLLRMNLKTRDEEEETKELKAELNRLQLHSSTEAAEPTEGRAEREARRYHITITDSLSPAAPLPPRSIA